MGKDGLQERMGLQWVMGKDRQGRARTMTGWDDRSWMPTCPGEFRAWMPVQEGCKYSLQRAHYMGTLDNK